MKALKLKLIVVANFFATAFCIAQQGELAICHLGELKNDSLLPYIDSLQLNCSSTDVVKFKQSLNKLNSLRFIVLQGDANENNWKELFEEIKSKPLIKTLVFDNNTFSSLPDGYNNLLNIEQLSISNNEDIDYFQTVKQLSELSNLKTLDLAIYSIADLPDSLFYLKNIYQLNLVAIDEGFLENDSSAFSGSQAKVYDFSIHRNGDVPLSLKYVSLSGNIDSVEYNELVKRITSMQQESFLSSVSNTRSYTPLYKNVKPPIPGLDVETNYYTINAGTENILTYASGTKIVIPADAFVDKNGNLVKENITISYREFRDPIDFLVSGIPMKYDSGGVISNFESAGMFEINASIKQESLKLAAGKKITMDFVSTSKDTTYNFYAYNDSTGNWSYLNKPKPTPKTEKAYQSIFSNAINIYKYNLTRRLTYKDSTKLNARFESLKYFYTYVLDSNYNERRFSYVSNRKETYRKAVSLVRITRVIKNKAGDVFFKIKYLNQAHPELRGFENVYFKANENISISEFKKKYSFKQFYNDIRIYKAGGGIEIKLKGIRSFKTIDAEVVTLNDKREAKNVKDLTGRMRMYNKLLKNREHKYGKKIKNSDESETNIPIYDSKEISLRAFNDSKQYMTKEEKKLSYNEWVNYCDHAVERERQAVLNAKASKENLLRSLTIDNMGIYNCDQIQRLQNPVEILAKYKNKTLEKLSPVSTYIIDKKVNAVMQYDGHYGYSPNKIAFCNDRDAQNVLLAVNANGKMAVYKTDQFKQHSFSNKDVYSFEVEEIKGNISNVAELKKIMGL